MQAGFTSQVIDGFYLLAKAAVGAHAGGGKQSLWAVGSVFWKYLQLMLFPVHMSVERSTDLPPNVPSIEAVAAWLAVVALSAGAYALRERSVVLSRGLGLLLLGTLPYCGFVYIYQGVAERFAYVASMSLVVVSASIATHLPLAPAAFWLALYRYGLFGERGVYLTVLRTGSSRLRFTGIH